jgi:hypothetical protein
MEENDNLKLFMQFRKFPWIPEHKVYIEARLAAMKVEDPDSYDEFRAKYDQMAAEYEAENPEVEAEEAVQEVQAEEKVEDEGSEESVDYSSMKKGELVELAAEKGIDTKGLKKAEIISALSQN